MNRQSWKRRDWPRRGEKKAAATLDRAGAVVMQQCPVTGGNPTSMSAESFARLCGLARQRAAADPGLLTGYCLVCEAKNKPAELTIVDLSAATDQGDSSMGQVTEKGLCSSCDADGRPLKVNYGEKVCSSCSIMRMVCKNRPDVVWEQLRKLAPDFLDKKLQADGAEKIDTVVHDLVKDLVKVLVPQDEESIMICAKRRMAALEAALNENTDLVMQLRQKEQEVAELRMQIELSGKQQSGDADSSLLDKLREIIGAVDGDALLTARALVKKANGLETSRNYIGRIREALQADRDVDLVAHAAGLVRDLQESRQFNLELNDKGFTELVANHESTLLAKLREVLGAGDGDIVQAARLAADGCGDAKTLKELCCLDDGMPLVEYVESLLADRRDLQERYASQYAVAGQLEIERDLFRDEVRAVRAALRVGENFDGSLSDAARIITRNLVEKEREARILRQEFDRIVSASTAHDNLPTVVSGEVDSACPCGRDGVLLDLLIEALGDQVINLTAGSFKRLREVA
ncbi:MAG: hypothetical protein KQH59_18315 [Desulfobulbaceae bacterium]|nr:hypothetical protein [Desulfobulbaceae bacterium]